MTPKKFTFEYPWQTARDSVTGEFVFEYRPVIPVKLLFQDRLTPLTFALIDSGSDRNLFPAVFALQLGIDVRKGEKITTPSLTKGSLRHSCSRALWLGL